MTGDFLHWLRAADWRHWASPGGFPLRIGLGRAGMLILSAALFGGSAAYATPIRHELPMRAIVQGHNIQPRGDQLKALGYADLTPQQADEVDRLYRQLMRLSTRTQHRRSTKTGI